MTGKCVNNKSEIQLLYCDKQLKNTNSFLSWHNLLKSGLSLETANNYLNTRYLQKIRLELSCFESTDTEQLYNHLICDNFTEHRAAELSAYFNTNKIEGYLEFIKIWYAIKSIRNVKLEYWLERGHNPEDAKKKMLTFFQAWANEISRKRENLQYNKKFIESRKIGGAAAAKSFKNINKSKVEIDITNELINENHAVNTNFYSPVVNIELRQIHTKYNYLHDILLDNKVIIEYNGIYWHKDFTHFKQFTEKEYFNEIIKAYNCLHDVKNRESYKYVVIWENDIPDVKGIVNFIKDCVKSKSTQQFFSTRPYDIAKFKQYKIEQIELNKQIIKYKKKLIKFQENKCGATECTKKRVYAIAVKHDKIIAVGNNRTITQSLNCYEHFFAVYKTKKIDMSFDEWKKTDEYSVAHRKWAELFEIHAEMSILIKTNIESCDLYVSLKPCNNCIKHLAGSGVKRIYYITDHNKTSPDSIKLLNKCGITLKQI